MQNLENYKETLFESIKHIDDQGCEYWEARELQKVLEYNKWENFHKVIKKAMIACKRSNNSVLDHFPEVRKMVETGDSIRKIVDYYLSRYACYLISQNGDPRKEIIALAQSYFAFQTRKQELLEEEYEKLSTPIKSVKELENNKKEIV